MQSSSPPPNASPVIAATTGFDEVSISDSNSVREGLADMAGKPNSPTSAPPQNAVADPAITTAPIDASFVARSSPSATAVRKPTPKALTGGFFRVITATAPREV